MSSSWWRRSVGVVAEQRLEGTLPLVAPAFDQYIGRRLSTLDRPVESVKIHALVIAAGVQLGARLEAATGDCHDFACQVVERPATEGRIEPGLGRLGAEEGMVLGGPGLHQVPGRIERAGIVQQPDPEGR